MPLDFNRAPAQAPGQLKFDRPTILAALRMSAYQWVPALFPAGKADSDGKGRIWRVADIAGGAPRKQGSCVIRLNGEHAGSYKDHSGNVRGNDAVGTVADHFKLNGLDALEKAAEIAEQYGGRVNGHASLPRRKSASDHKLDAAHELSRSVPTAGTLAATYFSARGLTLPVCDDLRFSADCTHWETETKIATAKPALLAVIRYPDGRKTGGIHRIYLKDDGSGHLDKKMLGPTDGGVVMLDMPLPGGELGVAEGIETAAAATRLYGIPCWSTLSAGGMPKFGAWLVANPNVLAITRLVIFADRGDTGERDAATLRDAAIAAGLASEVHLPRGGDDFNDDLVNGVTIGEPEILPPAPVLGFGELMAKAKELNPESHYTETSAVLRGMALAKLESISIDQLIDVVRTRLRTKKATIEKAYHEARRELGLEAKTVGGTRVASWYGKLRTRTDSGDPKATVGNAIAALRDAPEWRDILWFDEFQQQIILRGKAPWMTHATEIDWSDYLDTKTTEWLQGYDVDVTPTVARQAIDVIARENPFHPVKEYLESLHWDGKARLDIWLTYHCGAEPSPIDPTLSGNDLEEEHKRHDGQTKYIRAVGACWMISAVARIYDPGCKADCALILEGPQGKKKSMTFSVLAGPWFVDEIADFGTKDASIQLLGIWIAELAELSAIRRSDRERTKAFMSRPIDNYRPVWGHRRVKQPRQCIFGGTTNDNEYLNDPTGGRRWWPIKCGEIDIEALKADRDQLWAEALARYRAGERWWLEGDEIIALAQREQAARSRTDVWDERISKFLSEQMIKAKDANREIFLTRADVLHELGIPDKDQTQIHANRVSDCLVRFGWERFQVGKGSLRGTWAYRPKKVENKKDER
jgi:putative DNA primase/helicase